MQPKDGVASPSERTEQANSAGVQAAALAGFLAASFLVAALGGFSTVSNVDGWYATADKAPWTAGLWLALAVILALIAAVTVTVLYFGPISRTAGLLLLPYVAWLVFAAALNLWAAMYN
jgi:tryptophan-rich sensory protein